MFETNAVLHYIHDDGYWLTAALAPDLGAYYRALLPKSVVIERGPRDTHVTVVRGRRDVPANMAAWGKYEGEKVSIQCEPGVFVTGRYYWLRALCKRFEDIRTELGLPLDNGAYEVPPAPFAKYWHITVGRAT